MMVWDVPVAAQEPAGTVPRDAPACPCGRPARKRLGSRYCSDRCKRAAATQRAHETGKTTRLRNDLLALLRSGSKEWTPGDLTRALGATWAAISPRLRDLRKRGFGGWNVQGRVLDRHNGSWRWVYWLDQAQAKREVG
jgi:hypothetical protein